mmetsp:Transcript_11486/g.18750  ORF Transcript_11486/g.18750 Transcript_11486/m.18750 type:complete len:160 (-) Transcript_11486:103-582(-)
MLIVLLRRALCIFLSMTFLLTGLCKIIPHVHADTYHFLDAAFRNEIVPAWQLRVFNGLGVKVHPLVFKFLVGNLEAFCAIVLWAGGTIRRIASFLLTIIMANACLTHYWLDQDFGFPLTLMICSALVCVLSFSSERKLIVIPSPTKAAPKHNPKKEKSK